MVGNERSSTRPSRRVALTLVGVTALVLAAAIAWAGPFRDGSEPSGQGPEPVAETIAAAEDPDGANGSEDAKPESRRERGKRANPENARQEQRSSAAGTSDADAARDADSAGAGDGLAKCVKIFGRAQCKAIAAALTDGQSGSHVVKPNECPPVFDRKQCRALGKALEDAEGGSQAVKPNECPPALSRAQCKAAGKALQAALQE